jgi:glutamate synthase domain-containing protein 2
LTSFFMMILAVIAACSVLGIIGFLLGRVIADRLVDTIVKRLMTDPYPENLTEMVNVLAKEGAIQVLESDLRATDGKPLKRPFGSARHMSDWEQLMFNPVYLSKPPLELEEEIDLGITIGPLAKKPLRLEIPVIIGAMAYGVGLSKNARLALAKGADMVGTAVNAGVGPLLSEERKLTRRLILQYHRGNWGKDDETLLQADMIEIQLGYGALGSAPVSIEPDDISPEFRQFMELKPREGLNLNAMLSEARNARELSALVDQLKIKTGGVPVGIKIGATHWLERELEVICRTGIDFIAIDGAEAGINFGPTALLDEVGLPTLPALCRTVEYLRRHRLSKRISLIISGGLVTPGQFLKALALGADAVAIGTIVVLAMSHTQISKTIPWEPPTELVYERGKMKEELNVAIAEMSVANFLKSCRDEMCLVMRCLGKSSIDRVDADDLSGLSAEVVAMAGVAPTWSPCRRR